jgi:hypothetical protein
LTKATTGTTRGLIALVLLVLLVAGVIGSGVLIYRQGHLTDEPFTLGNSGQTIPDDAARHTVVAVAEQFCLRMDGVDGSDTDGYVKRVSELLTTKQKAKFTSEFEQFQKLGIQPGLKGTGTILASGLTDMDADSATVLVAHDSAVKDSGATTQRHYRWTVNLRKVSGTWLVDDFTPVS